MRQNFINIEFSNVGQEPEGTIRSRKQEIEDKILKNGDGVEVSSLESGSEEGSSEWTYNDEEDPSESSSESESDHFWPTRQLSTFELIIQLNEISRRIFIKRLPARTIFILSYLGHLPFDIVDQFFRKP